MKIRVPIFGTVGKAAVFDPQAGARAEAAVAALREQISVGLGGTIQHRNLLGLQIGNDHPQYTMWQAPETIQGQWNFQTIPFIQGDTLAEYIEDVIGRTIPDFLEDTSSVVWTYHDSANLLEANVPPEFVQDTVGAMLTDSTSIDFTYNDPAGTFTAVIIDEYVQDLVGAMLVDTSTVDFTYDDPTGQISAVVPGAALTKTDDTNVTLTLGGSPTTALARAASLTLGWTGTLAVPRGGSGAATLSGYLKGNGTSAFTASATIPYSDISGTPTIPTGANPTASVGLSAVNGSAATFLRSDGAPALSQAISPTWTGNHVFAPSSGNTAFTAGNVGMGVAAASVQAFNKLEVAGGRITVVADNDYGFTHFSSFGADNQYFLSLCGATGFLFQTGRNGSRNIPFLGFATADQERLRITPGGDVWLVADSREFQIGAGQDLRLYHDGTDSWINNDTGNLFFDTPGRFEFRNTATHATIRALTTDASSIAELRLTRTTGTANDWENYLPVGSTDIRWFSNGADQLSLSASGILGLAAQLRLKSYTVATLPAAAAGDTAFVTDALAPVFGAAVAGGGAVKVPVYYTGAAWFVG